MDCNYVIIFKRKNGAGRVLRIGVQVAAARLDATLEYRLVTEVKRPNDYIKSHLRSHQPQKKRALTCYMRIVSILIGIISGA